jgi:plastocyanin
MRMRRFHRLLYSFGLASTLAFAQSGAALEKVDVHLRLAFPETLAQHRIPPAVLWLKPLPGTPTTPFPAHGQYMLVQKNRMFMPHLLVVPVGSEVLFPNRDPFFHDVFSKFDGKRFDLGLYEAGSTRGVTFSREGVSYIFCNIHPEMSAVVVALSTPLYAIADASGAFQLPDVPAGEYELHVWVEGTPQPSLDRLSRDVHLAPGAGDLGELSMTAVPQEPVPHLNKFGRPYDQDSKPAY